MGKKDWYKVEIRELIRKNLGKIHRKVGDSYGIDVSYLHKMISDYATQELSKAREEGARDVFTKDEWFMLKLAMNDIFNGGNRAYEDISNKIKSQLSKLNKKK